MAAKNAVEVRTVSKVLDSTLESVDSAEKAVLREAQDMRFDEDDLYKIGLSVRESVVNAVVHGNRYSSRKMVGLTISQTPDRLVVVITDEGAGFNVGSVHDPLADANLLRSSGRGLMMIQAFMDEIQIRTRTPRGTEVKMVKYAAKASS